MPVLTSQVKHLVLRVMSPHGSLALVVQGAAMRGRACGLQGGTRSTSVARVFSSLPQLTSRHSRVLYAQAMQPRHQWLSFVG